jgi:membrane protease YdiL (CAAX protease family)
MTLWKTGLLVVDKRLPYGSDIFRYGTIWLLGFFLVGLLEEYLTRGYLQYTLTRGLSCIYELTLKSRHSKVLGFWTAAAIFSILFGLGHGSRGESPIGLLSAGWRRWSSASVFGAPALYGGRWGSTRRGTGASRFSMASRTAELWSSTISSPRILWGNRF